MVSTDQHRVSKREFIARVAFRSGRSAETVATVYEALFDELIDSVQDGKSVVLQGIGRFYRQDHKGHKVRFGHDAIKDYSVLKFSASRGVNRRLDGGTRAEGEAADEEADPDE